MDGALDAPGVGQFRDQIGWTRHREALGFGARQSALLSEATAGSAVRLGITYVGVRLAKWGNLRAPRDLRIGGGAVNLSPVPRGTLSGVRARACVYPTAIATKAIPRQGCAGGEAMKEYRRDI